MSQFRRTISKKIQQLSMFFSSQAELRITQCKYTYCYHVPYRNNARDDCLLSKYQSVLTVNINRFYSRNNGKKSMSNSKTVSQRRLRRDVLRDAIQQRQKMFRQDVDMIQDAIQDRKERLKMTERRIRAKGKMIMQDIKETKDKMKEKMEDVIERENVYTIPNLLCVTRIVFSPYLGYLIITQNFEFALGFMVVAGISDWVDGWIARNYKSQSSKIGSFLDPMADKVLIGTLFLTLTYVDLIPVPLTGLIIVRDVALVVAGFVIRYKSLPPPRTLSKYFDVTYATAQLAPTFISKVNTGVQLILVASTLAAPVFGYVNHPALQILWYITATSTIAAAASYLLSKETFKYLRDKGKRGDS